MNAETSNCVADSAAVFACAISLWAACHKAAGDDPELNLSDAYSGMDQLMREAMRIANLFEDWACEHVAFEELADVWPYLLDEHFGGACLEVMEPDALKSFNADDCLRVACRLRLPMWIREGLALPFLLEAENPIAGSAFHSFRIQTVREELDGDGALPFETGDECEDEDFGVPYFAIDGVRLDGTLEHIADRQTYQEAAGLLRGLFPTIELPERPVCSCG